MPLELRPVYRNLMIHYFIVISIQLSLFPDRCDQKNHRVSGTHSFVFSLIVVINDVRHKKILILYLSNNQFIKKNELDFKLQFKYLDFIYFSFHRAFISAQKKRRDPEYCRYSECNQRMIQRR